MSVILSRSAAEAKNLVVCLEKCLCLPKTRFFVASLLRMTSYQNQCGRVLVQSGVSPFITPFPPQKQRAESQLLANARKPSAATENLCCFPPLRCYQRWSSLNLLYTQTQLLSRGQRRQSFSHLVDCRQLDLPPVQLAVQPAPRQGRLPISYRTLTVKGNHSQQCLKRAGCL
jgi:hypothetical protein